MKKCLQKYTNPFLKFKLNFLKNLNISFARIQSDIFVCNYKSSYITLSSLQITHLK